jgi:hypothetical protein
MTIFMSLLVVWKDWTIRARRPIAIRQKEKIMTSFRIRDRKDYHNGKGYAQSCEICILDNL